MNYEKKYKEALEKAKDYKEKGTIHRELEVGENIMEYIFPELKESEDEKIKKELLEHVQLCTESIPDRDKFITWIDKHGKQKLVEWNERDERVLTEIINDVKFTQSKNPNSYMNQLLFKKEIDWLESLKQRIKEE